MSVILNDTSYELSEGSTLASFIDSLGIRPQGVAVAVDDIVIPKTAWATTVLRDKAQLMLIHAVSGG